METISKSLPQNAEEILQLALQIVDRHVNDGPNSPLSISHVAEINAKAAAAQRKHEEGMRFLKFAQEFFKERDHLLGIAQAEGSPNNILYHIQSIYESLQELSRGSDDLLTHWGFPEE